MSEQMSMPAGGGLLTLNLSLSPQGTPSLGSGGGALFSGFGSLLSQQPGQGQGSGQVELAAGAFLPQSGITLPQADGEELSSQALMQQQMLYVAQMLEQQYGESGELPPEISAELAQALRQYAEQRPLLPTDDMEEVIPSELVVTDSGEVNEDERAVAGVVGPPTLLSESEGDTEGRTPFEILSAKLNQRDRMGEKAADLVGDAKVVDETIPQMPSGLSMGNSAEEGATVRPIGPLDVEGVRASSAIDAQLIADKLASRALSVEERAAQLQAQRAVDETSGVAPAAAQASQIAQVAQTAEAEDATKASVVSSHVAIKPDNGKGQSSLVSSLVDEVQSREPGLDLKKEMAVPSRASEKVDLANANIQKEIAAELSLKSETSAKASSGPILPQKFESALELSQQLMQKVTSSEKLSDSGFNQRMETLALSQNAQPQVMSQPTQAQKTVAEAQNLMMPQQVQINTPAWKNALGERAIMVSTQNMNVANIQLDPPELGSLSIRVNINQDQVSLSFTSPHAHVRDAVEQSLPRLREMFAEQGLSLQDSSVADQSADQQRREQFAEQDAKGASGGQYMGSGEVGESESVSPQAASKPVSLVDYYA